MKPKPIVDLDSFLQALYYLTDTIFRYLQQRQLFAVRSIRIAKVVGKSKQIESYFFKSAEFRWACL